MAFNGFIGKQKFCWPRIGRNLPWPLTGSISPLEFTMWVSSDPHTKKGIDDASDMLQTAITQINGGAFDFDLAVMLGDFAAGSVAMDATTDATEGVNNQTRLSALNKGREYIYTLAGNHDGGDLEQDWFNKYIDPLGNNTATSDVNSANFPYPITTMDTDTWHSYYITVGSYMIVMLSDRNDLAQPYGREDGAGGYPSGTITQETWDWVEGLLDNNTDKNIIICSHSNPRNTTIATGDTDGVNGDFHGDQAGIEGEGNIYTIHSGTPDTATTQITDYFANNSGHTCRMWIAGHTHTVIGDEFNSKRDRYFEDGVLYMNIAGITNTWTNTVTQSRSWQFVLTSTGITCKMYMHEVVGSRSIGFQEDFEQSLVFGSTPTLAGNSIIIARDNFDDNYIDTGKWTEITDANGTTSETGGQLELTAAATGGNFGLECDTVLSSGANDLIIIQAKATTPASADLSLLFRVSSSPWDDNNQIIIGRDTATPGAYRCIVKDGGVNEISQNTGIASGKDVRMKYVPSTGATTFEYWNGSAWTEFTSTAGNVDLGSSLIVRLVAGAGVNPVGAVIYDDFFVNTVDYSTQYPA